MNGKGLLCDRDAQRVSRKKSGGFLNRRSSVELFQFGKAAWAECARRAVCIQLVARVVDI